jgi:type IV fimbrial biogenesis protein FimT
MPLVGSLAECDALFTVCGVSSSKLPREFGNGRSNFQMACNMPDTTHTGSASRTARGFTLTEFMTTLAIASVLVTVAVPNMKTFIQNNRLSAAANDLLRSFQLARSQAIKHQLNFVVCASANPTAANPTCSYGPYNGWIVFQDTNFNWQVDAGEPVLERHELLDSSITVKTDNNGIESFASTGFANPAGVKTPTRNILVCDIRGNQVVAGNSTERAVLIAPTGRARVSKTSADVSSAAGAAGACP